MSLLLRPAAPADAAALARLAELDSARPPGGDVLLAFEDGVLVAALSRTDGRTVADPFRRTAGAVELLRLHAAPRPARRRRYGPAAWPRTIASAASAARSIRARTSAAG